MEATKLAHKRSKPKLKERATKRLIRYELKTKIWQESFDCPFWAETVCLTSHSELIDFGYDTFGENFSCTFVPDVDKGFILTDSRGRGVFQ